MSKFNPREEINKHILEVGALLMHSIHILSCKMLNHDKSKLLEPENKLFEKYSSKLRDTTYGSKKYYKYLKAIGPALTHHYRCNPHHPECNKNGIEGMSLFDLLEMICDWMSAVKKHKDGNIWRSIFINKKRFNISDQLAKILVNTVKELEHGSK